MDVCECRRSLFDWQTGLVEAIYFIFARMQVRKCEKSEVDWPTYIATNGPNADFVSFKHKLIYTMQGLYQFLVLSKSNLTRRAIYKVILVDPPHPILNVVDNFVNSLEILTHVLHLLAVPFSAAREPCPAPKTPIRTLTA